MTRHNAYRNGKVHVCREQCSTCIFRPGNQMHLEPGRVADMIADATKNESAIICHSTLCEAGAGSGGGGNAVCRGFFDSHPTAPLQIAERMGRIEFVTPPKLTQDPAPGPTSVATAPPKLRSVRRDGFWWITDKPTGFEDSGPYDTKREVEDDRPGLERFHAKLAKSKQGNRK